MDQRVRALWLPSLFSLLGAMAWRLTLQRSVLPSQPLVNHAGLPLSHQLLWLAGLPLFGAGSAYLNRRAGGSRSTRLAAALCPAIVMIPIWAVLATRMHYPSPAQWFGLFWGVFNWILTPGLALLLGAIPLLVSPTTGKAHVNHRARTFWFPALVSLALAMLYLSISTLAGLRPSIVAHGWAVLVAYIPWILLLPTCGALGAYLSRRGGGGVWTRISVAVFPVSALSLLVAILALTQQFVFATPLTLYVGEAVIYGALIPSGALILGAMPFLKTSE
jgi:hypothetical protein